MSEKPSREPENKGLTAMLRTTTRRKFIGWGSLVAGWAALPNPTKVLSLDSDIDTIARKSGQVCPKVTLLEDGSFQAGGMGWQLGQGCRIVSLESAPSPQVLYVRSRGTSTGRAVILSPTPGKTYTVHGLMRTQTVRPLEPDGCAVMSLDQLWYQAWFGQRTKFATLTGSNDWTPFSYTFECRLTEWFELSLGLYRAEGEAWFTNLTLVEGTKASEISDVIPREEERGFSTPSRRHKANVAIFRDGVPLRGTPTDPNALGGILQEAGYQVDYITAEQLSDPRQFSRDRFDILVLPYGPSFPAPAQKPLVMFLSKGGSFFSVGGYAFDNPLVKTSNGWIGEADALNEDEGIEMIGGFNSGQSLDAWKSAGWQIHSPECCSLDETQLHQGHKPAKVAVGEDGWWKEASWEYEVGEVHHSCPK